MQNRRIDDPATLQPAFRAAVVSLLERLRSEGHEPVLHETYRSPARAAELSKKGTGIALSMHTLGVAADVICARHRWSCREHGCGFYDALGAAAESLGMTWGGRWRKRDYPHVQGIPVAVQARARRSTSSQVAELLTEYLRTAGTA